MSDDRISVTECLQQLSITASRYGEVSGLLKACHEYIKVVEAQQFLLAEGSSEIRKAKARSSPEYIKKVEQLEELAVEEAILRARRATWDLHVEVWRSQNANRRMGNIT